MEWLCNGSHNSMYYRQILFIYSLSMLFDSNQQLNHHLHYHLIFFFFFKEVMYVEEDDDNARNQALGELF